ncbi:hypothetical protein BGZ57DRAFT_854166 [Hyaloscypha finlandica]|nr:hypothetical protein BGZ57DRAFT_854166 [Hyaloscypha finlandica]
MPEPEFDSLVTCARSGVRSAPFEQREDSLHSTRLPVIQHDNFKDYTAILACHYEDNYLGPLGIYISPVASANGDQFARDVCSGEGSVSPRTLELHSEDYPFTTSPDSGRGRHGALLFEKKSDTTKVLAVFVRSQGRHQIGKGFDLDSCSCRFLVLAGYSEDDILSRMMETEEGNTCYGTYCQVDLNPEDDISKGRETAFVKIGREVFLGQAMFVVDIGVCSSRLKKAPADVNATHTV